MSGYLVKLLHMCYFNVSFRSITRWSATCWTHRRASWTWEKTPKEWFRLLASQRSLPSTRKRLDDHKSSWSLQADWITPEREHQLYVGLFFFRSWNCWWRATSSAPRSPQRPIRRHPAPTRCCRWPSSSRVAVVTCCRRSASHASSWLTSPALNGQRRCVADGVKLSWDRFSFKLCAGVQFLKTVP